MSTPSPTPAEQRHIQGDTSSELFVQERKQETLHESEAARLIQESNHGRRRWTLREWRWMQRRIGWRGALRYYRAYRRGTVVTYPKGLLPPGMGGM